jgi:hypothetical protein
LGAGKGRAGTLLPAVRAMIEERTSHHRLSAGRGLPALPTKTNGNPVHFAFCILHSAFEKFPFAFLVSRPILSSGKSARRRAPAL